MQLTSTIAAIATPVGSAGIGVIRISGREAFDVASRLFTSGRKRVTDLPSHTAHFGALVNPTLSNHIDDVIITLFRAPSSYTGEDVVEISCHGGIAILKAALSAALDAGCRLAEPGEFTKRAFLNGKLDLTQAEAVNDLIRAQTDDARKVALRQLDGALSKRVGEINSRVLGVIAAIEAAIDFPDDVPEPTPDWLRSEIESARDAVTQLLTSFGRGRVYREGLRVVIAGRVNVGKSSLLNALLRHARAIVTPIPGTTRDVIEESLEIQGIPIVAIDTAGLRSTDDPVEKIGVERTKQSLESADIVLLVIDAEHDISLQIPDDARGKPTIIVMNKIDLIPSERLPEVLSERSRALGHVGPILGTSAAIGLGIEELERQIAELAAASNSAESVLVSNARHERLLVSSTESLNRALDTLLDGQPIDMLAIDLVDTRRSLGMITGETASDDLIDRIFGEFCIGK
ncbi:MAG: tRNA uridine-5-carboxymethylaminomethyl(34) synthesis GTPase MnmE [Armatimonadota bacterium]|nr:tRNA uridine-5-carboxymethylaminomethyl(34) synthesis GTPase MnmE [bacterium]